ncbi:uncharacterized protein SPPG_04619 [Spizellomyces punctatus DAOM BR117]|uniref:TM7S3/TM198-like domain-containing protein n=1 Tax=Spizellomyces punctatus (strain DAOM BR117) TaxID=645134 RepID=A0A0L0HHE8_SPIPD|nr:uncharacterized protein SPPG_04619 [Spizellomyces punctatus DAOM BR117]KND00290.1 hypothetical protein SPPG_04619 [Spizellomyces punctatus DAOM BR117]|eukprot:XP_016608329.1 hypothetical protein SPPG_04619 [Spizellomyces punctatus DAOM BR117]
MSIKQGFSLQAILLWLLAGLTLVAAQTDAINDIKEAITAQTAVAGALAIILGFVLLFWGHRLFYPTLFLAGFFVFGTLGYSILLNLEPQPDGWSNRDTILLLGSLACGIVGGLLAVCLVKLGLACIGALGGFSLAMFILSFQSGGVIQSGLGRTIFIIAMVVVGAIAIFFLVKPVLIVSTAVAGAMSIVLGIDVFARTGFTPALRLFLTGNRFDVSIFTRDNKVLALLITAAVLAIVGILVQFRTNRGRTFGHK